MVRVIAALILCLGVSASLRAGGARAGERVDLELVLLADASRSIDEMEIRLQRQGYATAITHPEVLAVIGSGYERRIAVTYVEWGDADSQEVVVPWTIVDGAKSAAGFAEALLATPRLAAGPNAIGSALAAGHALIEGNVIDGTRRVIDFSGDSSWSGGGLPVATARAAALGAGIVINGLAILCDDCSGRPADYDLEAAFATFITGGPGSFVITADGNTSFAEAVRRKLLLEIAGGPDLEAPDGGRLAALRGGRSDSTAR
ncbi:MAG: DUF1194 domain-containing protein [Rhodospirillales bacterium]|nr:DUF1194 domain-containing protein [Rhodospirillales bacterium]